MWDEGITLHFSNWKEKQIPLVTANDHYLKERGTLDSFAGYFRIFYGSLAFSLPFHFGLTSL